MVNLHHIIGWNNRLNCLQFRSTPQSRSLEIFNSDHVEAEKAAVKINWSLENQASVLNNDLNMRSDIKNKHNCIHPNTCLHQYILSTLVDVIWLISIYINAFMISCPWKQYVEKVYTRCSEDIQYVF